MTPGANTLVTPRRFGAPAAPPHDPWSLLLAGWVGAQPDIGWRVRALTDTEFAIGSNALVLCPSPNAQRRAAEPSGSLGGLRLPINVATGPRGEVWLLDPVSGQLQVFDACKCAFRPLPCTTRAAAPRPSDPCLAGRPTSRRHVPSDQVLDAHGLAACGPELFVADAGHSRVLRFAMRSLMPHGEWCLPPAQQVALTMPWSPGSMAFDSRERLHVADAVNQRVDRFDAAGRWQRAWVTQQRVWHIALDDADRLWVLLADADALVAVAGPGGVTTWQWQGLAQPAELWRFASDSAAPPVRIDLRSEQIAGFAPLPFAVDAIGRLRLPCDGCADASALFDARGSCVQSERQAPAPLYRRQGSYLSAALDSAIDGCTWHRVELRGAIPVGCGVGLRTLTADIVFDDAELALLGDDAWSAPIVASSMAEGCWDALVRSLPGRYLWLRLDLTGDGMDTPQLCAALVEYPRISLRRYLPAVFGAEPISADFTDRFTAIFDASLRSIEARLDNQAALFDPLSAPAGDATSKRDFLDWLAGWIGLSLEREWPEARRRRYLKAAAALYAQRGTPQGLRAQLLVLLGLDRAAACCVAERPQTRCAPRPLNCGVGPALVPAAPPALLLEHFKLRRWLFAGQARLGDDSVLWGRSIVNRSQLGGSALVAPAGCSTGSGGASASGGTFDGNARLAGSQLVSTPDPYRDPLIVHANRVSLFVPACVRKHPADERALRQLLATEMPAHVQAQVHFVEPRFRVGVQAMVGLDTVIARTPMGVRLGDEASAATTPVGLGRATVLPARPAERMHVGRAHVGGSMGVA